MILRNKKKLKSSCFEITIKKFEVLIRNILCKNWNSPHIGPNMKKLSPILQIFQLISRDLKLHQIQQNINLTIT